MSQPPRPRQLSNGVQASKTTPAPSSRTPFINSLRESKAIEAQSKIPLEPQVCRPPCYFKPSKATRATPSRTPLGEPIGPRAASQLVANPLEWHLQYWLDIGVIGVLRGVDATLMDLRLEIEIDKLGDKELKAQIHRKWDDYQLEKRVKCQRHFTEEPVPTDEIRAYVRDLDRMLDDKERKAREYLRRVEKVMMNSLQAARAEEARAWFESLLDVYQRLDEETRNDAEPRR